MIQCGQAASGLRRENKLLNSAQFSTVFNNRKSVHGKFFSIHSARNTLGTPVARLGITVSRRVSKKAVQRNRIKRQIRESFRLRHSTLSQMDFVVLAKKGSADQINQALRVELDYLWDKAEKKCENC